MIKYSYCAIFIFAIFLLCPGVTCSAGPDYTKDIEILQSDINVDRQRFPAAAYLYLTLKNNGNLKVSNVALKISYYDKEEYLILKTVIKNALNKPLPQAETRKYKIRLKGDIVHIARAQYPYAEAHNIDAFDVEIISTKRIKS